MSAPAAAATMAEWAWGLELDDVPPAVRERIQTHVLDALGCALCAYGLGEADAEAEVVRQHGGNPEATVIGSAVRAPASQAALVNGTLIHALDYDDSHLAARLHPSAVVVPAAISCAEAAGSTGRELLAAACAAYEVGIRVGRAAKGSLHARGWHPTSVCGVFAAALAAAKLRCRSEEQITHALGIAGSQASGSMEFLRSPAGTKPFHAGWAAHAGITAAALAHHGRVGPATIFEGRFGFLRSFADEFDADALVRGLGSSWESLDLTVKGYPTCHYTHAFVDALATLLSSWGGHHSDIDRIVCHVPSQDVVDLVLDPVDRKAKPATAHEARFSLPYCLGALAVRGSLNPASFTPEAIVDRDALAVAERVRHELDPARGRDNYWARVTLWTKDGISLERTVEQPLGAPGTPVPYATVVEKFRSNTEGVLTPAAAKSLLETVSSLQERRVTDVTTLLTMATTVDPHELR